MSTKPHHLPIRLAGFESRRLVQVFLLILFLAPWSANAFDEHLTFNDNQIPNGWTLRFPTGPGRNASVQNQRFEARQVDTYAELIRDKALAGSTAVEIGYTGNIDNVYWGQGNQIHLYRTDSDYLVVSIGKQGYGIQGMKVGISSSTNPTSYLDKTFAPNYGAYRVEATFRNGQIGLRVTKIGSTSPLYQGTVSVPEMRLDLVQKIGLFALTTTGSASWIDDVDITRASVVPIPDYQYDGANGPQAVKDFRITPAGQCAFTFAAVDTGSMCLVSSSSNLRQWFPLIHFNTTAQGTEVLDTPRDPSKFYRTTYLPTGVSAAESFDYPIGTGSVSEQITPERNDLYPSAPIANPERGSVSPGTGWYNVQDVGSYYAEFGGLHGGEDWNKGSGSADVGEQVKAVANGQVIDIRPAGASGIPSTSGYALVIRHWLLDGESVDSLYVHIAPDQHGGSFNSSGVVGDKSNFTFQIGTPVTKGSVIGVIGAVSAFSPHLHFEVRNKAINIAGSLWANDTGNGYYGPGSGTSITAEQVQAAFLLMQKDGIIDPSDFIDDHR